MSLHHTASGREPTAREAALLSHVSVRGSRCVNTAAGVVSGSHGPVAAEPVSRPVKERGEVQGPSGERSLAATPPPFGNDGGPPRSVNAGASSAEDTQTTSGDSHHRPLRSHFRLRAHPRRELHADRDRRLSQHVASPRAFSAAVTSSLDWRAHLLPPPPRAGRVEGREA